MSAAQSTTTKTKPKAEPVSTQTVNDVLESMDGHEEDAVIDQFGAEVFALLRTRKITGGRALIYVDQRRKGLDVSAAKAYAMGLTIRAVDDYFTEETDASGEDERPA